MLDTATLHIDMNSFAVYNKYDPTRTTPLRNEFARDMNKRFDELTKVIKKAVVDQDCFGLSPSVFPRTYQEMTPPRQQAFQFPLSRNKVDEFMKWLQEQVNKGLLEVGELEQIGVGVEERWTNKYILDSYKRGIIRARSEIIKAGGEVPSIDETGGIEISMSTPFHIDRLGLLYLRTYNDLKGITTTMSGQIARVLAQGIADGDGPRLLARKLMSAVDGEGATNLGITDTLGRFIPAKRRAEILARTEIIRAHHVATIQEYRNWGVIGVKVQAEWLTAEDRRVCSRCEEMEKHNPYPLDVIEKLIPLHPQCRCVALPYMEGMKLITKVPLAERMKRFEK